MPQATCASSLSLPIGPVGTHWIINLFSCLPRSPMFQWGYVGPGMECALQLQPDQSESQHPH